MNVPAPPFADFFELRSLLRRVCDETAGPPERARLEAIVAAEPAARDYYVRYMTVHAELVWMIARRGPASAAEASLPDAGVAQVTEAQVTEDLVTAEPSAAVLPSADEAPRSLAFLPDTTPAQASGSPLQGRVIRLRIPAGLLGIAVTLLLVAYFSGLFALLGMARFRALHRAVPDGNVAEADSDRSAAPAASPVPQEDRQPAPLARSPLARIVAARQCQWDGPTQAPAVGQSIAEENLQLRSGSVHLELTQGVALVVEGPAEWSALDGNRVRLTYGKLTATVPVQAIGFTVKTPSATITDRGTEFAVTVDRQGTTQTQVLRGVVDVQREAAFAAAAGPVAPPRQLVAGQAATIHPHDNQIRVYRAAGSTLAHPANTSISLLAGLLPDQPAGGAANPQRQWTPEEIARIEAQARLNSVVFVPESVKLVAGETGGGHPARLIDPKDLVGHLHEGILTQSAWYSNAPNGNDYFDSNGPHPGVPPAFVFDLGQDRKINVVYVWHAPYWYEKDGRVRGVLARDFHVRFATGAEGADGLGKSIAPIDGLIVPKSTLFDKTPNGRFRTEPLPIPLGATVEARYVEMTITDVWGGHDPMFWNNRERVALGQVYFGFAPSLEEEARANVTDPPSQTPAKEPPTQ